MTIRLAALIPPKFKGILQSLVAERWLESFSLVSHSRTGHGTGIFTYIWLMLMVNVDIRTSPVDASWDLFHKKGIEM